jgi:hypothetical protein
MKSRRVPARSPVLAPLGCWPHHLQPETLGSRSYSASSALACEEASAQVLGLHIARLTNPPLYRESRWHRGRALLNDLHPLKESGGRRGHVSSSRKVVWARDCPTRRGTNGIVPLSGVRVEFIASSLRSSLRRGNDDGESVPHFGSSLRWDTSHRGARKKGTKGEQRVAASARSTPGGGSSPRLEEPGDRSVHRRPPTRTEGVQRRRCEGVSDGGFDGFGLSDRLAPCPGPLGELRRISRTLFVCCGTTNSEFSGSGCLGTLAATSPAREAIPALLAVLEILFGFFRFRGG